MSSTAAARLEPRPRRLHDRTFSLEFSTGFRDTARCHVDYAAVGLRRQGEPVLFSGRLTPGCRSTLEFLSLNASPARTRFTSQLVHAAYLTSLPQCLPRHSGLVLNGQICVRWADGWGDSG